jgi:hypothetical protein
MANNNSVTIGQTDICVVCGDHIRAADGSYLDVRNETCCVKCIPQHDDPCAEQIRHLFRG